jgi:hypothetical protein
MLISDRMLAKITRINYACIKLNTMFKINFNTHPTFTDEKTTTP